MENAGKKHIDFLDQIRGIAIVAVFLFHSLGAAFGHTQLAWHGWLPDFNAPRSFLFLLPCSLGWAGVAIFFVVSGFCIHLSFANRKDWGDFYVRRFFRVYPPYFLAVLLFALLIPWTRIHGFGGYVQFGTHLTLIHNFDNNTFFGLSPAFWSIAVESQLYLLYPVLLWLVKKRGWCQAMVWVALVEIGLRLGGGVFVAVTGEQPPLWFAGLPFYYWFSWAIGALMAEAYLLGRPIPFSRQSVLAWGVLALASCFLKPLTAFSFLFFALATAVAIAKLLTGNKSWQIPFVSPCLQLTGVVSYSLYLLHQPFLALAPKLAARFPFGFHDQMMWIFVLCLGLWFPILALAAIWYRALETSGIAIGRKIGKKLAGN